MAGAYGDVPRGPVQPDTGSPTHRHYSRAPFRLVAAQALFDDFSSCQTSNNPLAVELESENDAAYEIFHPIFFQNFTSLKRRSNDNEKDFTK
jgi:hypothetical protein